MKPWLNVKMAGLPRWAWVALLAGGVGAGLYLHSLNQESEGEGDEETEELPSASPQSLESYEGESGGGLQALGVAGPTPQATVPVEAPYLPEGITDVLGSQNDTVQALANGVLEGNMATNELAQGLAEREPQREIIREQMLGGAPTRKPHHKAPAKHPKKKAKPKKQQTKKPKKPKKNRR